MPAAEYQRDRITDKRKWRAAVKAAREADDASRLGELLRIHPAHVNESIDVLGNALRRARSPRAKAIAQLRMANSLQYASRHEEALRWFARADRTVRSAHVKSLRDFVEQHRGKCLAEMGRYEEARGAFRTALRLRTRRRRVSRSLVASTKRALDSLPRP